MLYRYTWSKKRGGGKTSDCGERSLRLKQMKQKRYFTINIKIKLVK